MRIITEKENKCIYQDTMFFLWYRHCGSDSNSALERLNYYFTGYDIKQEHFFRHLIYSFFLCLVFVHYILFWQNILYSGTQ